MSTNRATMWIPGLLVVLAAGAATAHGLFEVAIGSGAPAAIAWLYPVITDGLAFVAYTSTSRLVGSGRRYAWSVVVLAAGLSGLAQATYLAGAVGVAPAGLRFGVGAWPAVAAAVAAHLLFLIGSGDERPGVQSNVQLGTCPTLERPDRPGVQRAVQVDHLDLASTPGREADLTPGARALDTARRHQRRERRLPSVRELQAAAGVSRGTAHAVLRELRAAANGHDSGNQPEDEAKS